MSMMDFASALGGPGGGGAAPPPEAAPEDEPSFETSLQALEVAEDALRAFIELDPDHSDRALAAKCLENVIKLQAANRDNAQQGGLMSMARAISGGPEANAGLAGGAY